MSELIDNSKFRKKRLKELILKLHDGESADIVRKELIDTLKSIPYGEVVEVEQELISEGLPETEVLRLCDIHGEVLEGHVDLSGAKEVPLGHPVDVFKRENEQLKILTGKISQQLNDLDKLQESSFKDYTLQLLGMFNDLMDVDKHYQRKEYLVFPFLEKNEITGPPKVMWGKHDEIRDQLKGSMSLLREQELSKQDLTDSLDLLYYPVLKAVNDMVQKEEEILFPMCMDVLTTENWWDIHRQTLEFGFTLYDPEVEWAPEGFSKDDPDSSIITTSEGSIQLPSGSLAVEEILAILMMRMWCKRKPIAC